MSNDFSQSNITPEVASVIGNLQAKSDKNAAENILLKEQINDLFARLKQERKEHSLSIEEMKRDSEFQSLQVRDKIRNLDQEYQEKLNALTLEKQRFTEEYQSSIRENANLFLDDTVTTLSNRERNLSLLSIIWSIAGAFILTFGLMWVVYISMQNSGKIDSSINWPSLIFYTLRGVTILTIVGFFARYNFIQSGNYMREALRVDDRIHGIKFGQLYIVTYGASAEWKEVKEALASWNGEVKASWNDNINFDELNKNLATIASFVGKKDEKDLSKDANEGDKNKK